MSAAFIGWVLEIQLALDESAGGEFGFAGLAFEGLGGFAAAEGDGGGDGAVFGGLFGAAEFFAGAGRAGAAVAGGWLRDGETGGRSGPLPFCNAWILSLLRKVVNPPRAGG